MFWSALGAMIAATITSAAVASQTGRKRAATTALATTCAERPTVAPSATRSLSPGEFMDRSIESGGTVESQPRPGVHSAHLELEVSTVTERTPHVPATGHERRGPRDWGRVQTRTRRRELGTLSG